RARRLRPPRDPRRGADDAGRGVGVLDLRGSRAGGRRAAAGHARRRAPSRLRWAPARRARGAGGRGGDDGSRRARRAHPALGVPLARGDPAVRARAHRARRAHPGRRGAASRARALRHILRWHRVPGGDRGGRPSGVAARRGRRRKRSRAGRRGSRACHRRSRPMSTRHVILLTYGEPPRADFFAQLRYSWRILLGLTRSVADIPAPLLPLIALMRAWTRTSTWARERYRSPLDPLTHEQASELQPALEALEPAIEWRVHVAYEFRDPLLTACLGALPGDEPALVVPAYVADSAFTHQLARDTLARWLSRRGGRAAPIAVLPPLPLDALAQLNARHLMATLETRG